MEKLLSIANAVPEMGNGGKKIKTELMREAKKILPGNSIVDLAPFLGSTTVFLALGLLQAGNFKSHIYSVDMWDINLSNKYQEWLKRKKINITDLAAEYVKNIKPFVKKGINIIPIKSDIRNFNYTGLQIQLLVDDLGVDKGITDHVLKSMIPFFIPGLTTIFFMDFFFYEDFHDYESRLYQRDLMGANRSVFEFVERPKDSRTAIYRYLGGKINYIKDDKYYYDFKGCM